MCLCHGLECASPCIRRRLWRLLCHRFPLSWLRDEALERASARPGPARPAPAHSDTAFGAGQARATGRVSQVRATGRVCGRIKRDEGRPRGERRGAREGGGVRRQGGGGGGMHQVRIVVNTGVTAGSGSGGRRGVTCAGGG